MMRTPDAWAVAVRRRDGTIHTERHAVDGPAIGGMFRGPRTIASALRVGMRALRVAVRETSGIEPTAEQTGMTLAAGGVAVLAIFVVAPGLFAPGRGAGAAAVEATIRLAMLAMYLFVVSRSAQTRGVLRYHGAEHKTVTAYESLGRVPAASEARAATPIHMRCGTTFITLFVISCGVVFAVVPRVPLWLGVIVRIALTPFVVALAYEVMRGAAREPRSIWARVVTWPGRALQRLTTREPDENELDVAVSALAALLF